MARIGALLTPFVAQVCGQLYLGLHCNFCVALPYENLHYNDNTMFVFDNDLVQVLRIRIRSVSLPDLRTVHTEFPNPTNSHFLFNKLTLTDLKMTYILHIAGVASDVCVPDSECVLCVLPAGHRSLSGPPHRDHRQGPAGVQPPHHSPGDQPHSGLSPH